MRYRFVAVMVAGALVGCQPQSTPLPTREKTIDRVKDDLQKAQDEAARRRAEAEQAAK
ncbi:MAG: hypothetical protein ING52_03615 [Burkholderiales bacterium]|jgi:hypothetical protein|nr:hypothetical protein [Burkholderiales bacterium]MCE2644015.1 hypothetical protein [Burkholderiaceae bacterium]MCA3215387.1 hypothetical protein [Burkholderiales bacterium]MCA3221249.1 hypothetical protein [Burkholderiales bacterium]MCA3224586.1 hypothetical protein [Burkholderiales bacterium]